MSKAVARCTPQTDRIDSQGTPCFTSGTVPRGVQVRGQHDPVRCPSTRGSRRISGVAGMFHRPSQVCTPKRCAVWTRKRGTAFRIDLIRTPYPEGRRCVVSPGGLEPPVPSLGGLEVGVAVELVVLALDVADEAAAGEGVRDGHAVDRHPVRRRRGERVVTDDGRSDVDVVVVAVRPERVTRGVGQHRVAEGVLGVEVRRFGRVRRVGRSCVHGHEWTTRG